MEQGPATTQTTQPKNARTKASAAWLRYFFSDDLSPANHATIELQRRAVWVSVALLLLSPSTLDYTWFNRALTPVGSIIPILLTIASFYALWRAFRPTPRDAVETYRRQPTRWQRLALLLILMLAIPGAVLLGRGVALCILQPQFSNDGTSLDTNAAILLLEGHNPYSDSSLSALARHFAIQPDWTTPLRQGQFANRLDYPSQADFRSVLDTALKSGNAPEFEEKVSYPSLSFLTLVPFVAVGDYNVLPFYIFCYLAIIFIAWKMARPAIRPWVLVLSMANVPMWSSAIGGNLDILYVLFLIVAWLFYTKRWTSALFLGLAVASKQIAWYFVPFYAMMLWRQYGWKEALYRLTIAGGLALALNLPFIIWDPHAWLAGVLAPIKDPMFPMGVGIVNMSVAHLIPYMPDTIYTILTYIIAMPAMLYCYWRICLKHPEAVMLLAILPLFFAWRSLPSYFYCTAFPLYILLVNRLQPRLPSISNKHAQTPPTSPENKGVATPISA
jgi:hypothetical protein